MTLYVPLLQLSNALYKATDKKVAGARPTTPVMRRQCTLFTRDNDPQDQVWNETREPTRQQKNDEQKSEPERTDAEKLGQTTAYPGKPPVPARTTKCSSLIYCLTPSLLLLHLSMNNGVTVNTIVQCA